MSVIRVVHNKENPFVQLNKETLWNHNISLKAIGLWARCMSRPDDWRFNVKELVSKSKEGRRAIDAAIKELIKHNYAVRIEHWEKSEDGKFKTGGIEYVFFEFPATQEDKDRVLEEFKKSFRHCGFGNCRNGDSRNSNLLIKNDTDIEKKEYITGAQPPDPSPPPSKPPKRKRIEEAYEEVAPRVHLTASQLEALKTRCKAENLDLQAVLTKYSDWKLSKQLTGGSGDFKAITSWAIRAAKQDNLVAKPVAEPSQTQTHEHLAKAIALRVPKHARGQVSIGTNYIEFTSGAWSEHIKFTEHGFRERCLNILRKWGLPVDGL